MDSITRRELADILTPPRREHHETSRKIRQGLAKTFHWVLANDYRVDDPEDSALNSILRKVKYVPENHKALNYPKVAAAIAKVKLDSRCV